MKAAFFYSHQQSAIEAKPTTRYIDNLPYSEVKLLEDTEQVIAPNGWSDMELVMVVLNVHVKTWSGVKTLASASGSLKGRITINGILQL